MFYDLRYVMVYRKASFGAGFFGTIRPEKCAVIGN